MSVAAFDTLKFAQSLRDKAKLTPEQAEGIASAFAEATGDRLATKDDIAELRGDFGRLAVSMKEEIARLQVSNRDDIAKLHVSAAEDFVKLQAGAKEDFARLQVSNKDDIARAQIASKSDLSIEVSRLEIKIEGVKSEIIRWQFGTIGFQTLLMLGAVIALSRLTHLSGQAFALPLADAGVAR